MLCRCSRDSRPRLTLFSRRHITKARKPTKITKCCNEALRVPSFISCLRDETAKEVVNKSRSTQRPRRPPRRNAQGFLCVLCELCVQTSHFFTGSEAGYHVRRGEHGWKQNRE